MRWRAASAALILGFSIVAGLVIFNEVARASGLVSSPAKSSLVPVLHEVEITEGTVEPEALVVVPNAFVKPYGLLTYKFVHMQLGGDFWIGIKNQSDSELFGECINRFIRQPFPNCPAASNLNWEGFGTTEVGKSQSIKNAPFILPVGRTLRASEAEPVKRDAYNGQFKSDGSSCAKHGSVSGCLRSLDASIRCLIGIPHREQLPICYSLGAAPLALRDHFATSPLILASFPQFQGSRDEPRGDKYKHEGKPANEEAFVVVHELADSGRESRNAASEWFAYGLLFLLMAPIVWLLCQRWIFIVWAGGSVALLLIGAI